MVIEMPHKPLPQRAVGGEDPDYSPMDAQASEEAEIKMIKRKIQETAAKAHSTDRSKPLAAKGRQSETER